MDTSKPALLLLPNVLAEQCHHQLFLPASVDQAVATLDGLIAESTPGGRRYLSRFSTKKPSHLMPIAVYDGKSDDKEIDFLLAPIQQGERWGFVSDAGLPCIADPGSKLVKRARQRGIVIKAFVGPSSITLALMQSGLPGQKFTFHGYLTKEKEQLAPALREMERTSARESSTQIFMETPYRNPQVLTALLETLADSTWLCVAADLTLPSQTIVSQPLSLWKKSPLPNLAKKNAIFVVYAGSFR